jgi:type IV pilus assembly protein PilC
MVDYNPTQSGPTGLSNGLGGSPKTVQEERESALNVHSSEEKMSEKPGIFERRKVEDKEVLYLVDQLAIMFETGLNLLVALDCLALQSKNPAMKRIVFGLRDAIREGSSLANAMAQYPKVFGPVCVNMVRAGETGGCMDDMLARLSEYLEREIETRSQIKSALSYPIVMICMAFLVVAFLIIYVFPKFEVFFVGHEELLPRPTRIFLWIGQTVNAYWQFIVPGLAVLGVGVFYIFRDKKVQQALDRLWLKVPFLGVLISKSSLSRSFHTLSVLLHGGIPILEALKLSQEVAGNLVFKRCWGKVSEELENGRDFSAPLRDNPHIPQSEVQMLSLGERSGHLSMVLAKLSKHYEKELDYAIKSLLKFIEPALIICMGFLVGLIVMSLILPIFAISKCQG